MERVMPLKTKGDASEAASYMNGAVVDVNGRRI